jgi:hypothetical protein
MHFLSIDWTGGGSCFVSFDHTNITTSYRFSIASHDLFLFETFGWALVAAEIPLRALFKRHLVPF